MFLYFRMEKVYLGTLLNWGSIADCSIRQSDLSEHLLYAGVAADGVLKACCGTGGAYNWNASAICAMPGVVACQDPSAAVSWDGVHYTEAINSYIAKGWLHGPYADPPILAAIPHWFAERMGNHGIIIQADCQVCTVCNRSTCSLTIDIQIMLKK